MAWLLRVTSLDRLEPPSIIGGLLYTLKDPLNNVLPAVQRHSASSVFIEALTAKTTADDVTQLLNAGAQAIVTSEKLASDWIALGIPADRLIVTDGDLERSLTIAGGVAVENAEEMRRLRLIAEQNVSKLNRLAAVFYITHSVPDLVDQFTKDLQTDREDQLYTTVVTTPRRTILGVCYSSAESIAEAVRTGTGVYMSRKRGLWYKGQSSGATQRLLKVYADCDRDAVEFVVDQTEPGFCHNNTWTCFGMGQRQGLPKLEATVASRLENAVEGSYTKRLVSEPGLLNAKIREEADELCAAETREEIAFEAADLLYFVSVKLAQHGLSFRDVEADLDRKSGKITRRKGDAKPAYLPTNAKNATNSAKPENPAPIDESNPIRMHIVDHSAAEAVTAALRRPAQSSNAFELARPIVDRVRLEGDSALLEFTAKFEKAQLASPVLNAPFSRELMAIEPALQHSIDLACANVAKFHAAQVQPTLAVETMPGVQCRRFSRPIARIGLYVPGGTAILPSTAIHLGVPAQVAGCQEIVLATPPRADGTPSPEVVYVAHKIGAKQIVLAGGAQAVAAMAYGTKSVTKVDKILGPGNQFVTAAKMICSTDVNAQVSIDMPAGPSEVLVVADNKANKRFVVSDLLSQAEHGADSQVVLIAVNWSDADLEELQTELHRQATQLPRCKVVRQSIAHSSVINVPSIDRALELSNQYAPEHLILQLEKAAQYVDRITNAGSVFVGALSPESCGDYTSGTNHTLPTYGYANQYSGVNTDTYLKYITSQEVSQEGLLNIGPATVTLAEREGLQGHANAVKVRLAEF